MKKKKFLNFDTWRKKDHDQLLKAYIKAFQCSKKEQVPMELIYTLDKYTDEGAGAYDGNQKKWNTAYIIARELGIYRVDLEGNYYLSGLAEDFLNSKITTADYLSNYLLNFNQLINGQVIHPLYEVLTLVENNMKSNSTPLFFMALNTVAKLEDVINIEVFNLSETNEVNAKNMAKNLCRRIMYAKLVVYDENARTIAIDYDLKKVQILKECCKRWKGSTQEFIDMEHDGYVDMITKPNPVIFKDKGEYVC